VVNAERNIQEELPSTELLHQMERYYPQATARAAIGTKLFVQDLHRNHVGVPSKEILKGWKPQVDGRAKEILESELNDIPFVTISVGSEGAKEILYAGEAAPSLQGTYGDNRYGYPTIWKVSDVVEGTDFAVTDTPQATSVIALTPPEGIMPTPKDAHHMVKFVAPHQANGVVSLLKNPVENLYNLINVLGIKPKELTQVTLNPYKDGKLTRAINLQYIEAARKVGVNLEIIDAGDFVPGLRAILDPKKYGTEYSPMIVVGRSGWEETIMNGAAAATLGGFIEAIEYNEDPRIMAQNPLWTAKDLAPAPKETILVSTSFITADNNWFDQQGVTKISEKGCTVTTLVITHKGLGFRKIELPS